MKKYIDSAAKRDFDAKTHSAEVSMKSASSRLASLATRPHSAVLNQSYIEN